MADSGSGLFISFEGGEGSGKSTQLRRLADTLETMGYDVVQTRAPGGTNIGRSIREILLHSEEDLAGRIETMLFLADMGHLGDSVIRPALSAGSIVLCDRYSDSTIAYQGFARGLGSEQVAGVADWANGGLLPDLTLLLDVPPNVGLLRKSDDEWNRMEAAGLEFHERVREGLLQRAYEHPDRVRIVDAAQDPDSVFESVLPLVLERLPKHASLR